MNAKCLSLIMAICVLSLPRCALAVIRESTVYSLDLKDAKKISKETHWSDHDRITVTTDGLGWGQRDDEGSRDFWLQTEPIGVGLSWRPTSVALIKTSVEGTANAGSLYARYSADGSHWTTWQHLESVNSTPGNGSTQQFRGSLRVPHYEQARYQKLRMDYARRDDVSWSSDEEALVREILEREPKFFEQTTPFIGYVQFLYETQLQGGQRVTGLKVEAKWQVGGKFQAPKDESGRKGRDSPWRFKAK